MTYGADFKESVCMLQKTKSDVLRLVDVYKRRSPENDSHRNLACLVEHFLKMYEIAVTREVMSKFCLYFL